MKTFHKISYTSKYEEMVRQNWRVGCLRKPLLSVILSFTSMHIGNPFPLYFRFQSIFLSQLCSFYHYLSAFYWCEMFAIMNKNFHNDIDELTTMMGSKLYWYRRIPPIKITNQKEIIKESVSFQSLSEVHQLQVQLVLGVK